MLVDPPFPFQSPRAQPGKQKIHYLGWMPQSRHVAGWHRSEGFRAPGSGTWGDREGSSGAGPELLAAAAGSTQPARVKTEGDGEGLIRKGCWEDWVSSPVSSESALPPREMPALPSAGTERSLIAAAVGGSGHPRIHPHPAESCREGNHPPAHRSRKGAGVGGEAAEVSLSSPIPIPSLGTGSARRTSASHLRAAPLPAAGSAFIDRPVGKTPLGEVTS